MRDLFESGPRQDPVARGMVERMEKRQKPTGKAMRPKEGRFWYHARWIAINLVLIAVSAFLYAEYLIPRFIGGNDPPSVHTQDRLEPDDRVQPMPARVRQAANDGVGTSPKQGMREASRPSRARPRIYYSPDVMKREGLRCIGGIAYKMREVNGVTTVENYRSGSDSIRCRP